VRVLVAPDKFRGTLTAPEAARAIAEGWARADPQAEIEVVPVADGGEGTLDALVAALDGELRTVTVATGPLGDPTRAEFGLARSPEGLLGIVEMALASGLHLLSESRRDPRRTTTFGTGELILAACRAGARKVLVCIGGSATNDGGAGMAQAVGIRLLDGKGRNLRRGGAALVDLWTIDVRDLEPALRGVDFVVATDVDSPLTGPKGASAVYGPQKGATPPDVALLDRALGHLAAVIHRDLGLDVRDLPGAGAAGGLGAGLVAFLGAKLRPGVDLVMEAVRLDRRLERADVVVTGEGSFDRQSLRGKAPAGVLRAAERMRVPAVVLCGRKEADWPGAIVTSMEERVGLEAAMKSPRSSLERLAEEVAAEVRREDRPSPAPGGSGLSWSGRV
jgi:glycerate 2-kinase